MNTKVWNTGKIKWFSLGLVLIGPVILFLWSTFFPTVWPGLACCCNGSSQSPSSSLSVSLSLSVHNCVHESDGGRGRQPGHEQFPFRNKYQNLWTVPNRIFSLAWLQTVSCLYDFVSLVLQCTVMFLVYHVRGAGKSRVLYGQNGFPFTSIRTGNSYVARYWILLCSTLGYSTQVLGLCLFKDLNGVCRVFKWRVSTILVFEWLTCSLYAVIFQFALCQVKQFFPDLGVLRQQESSVKAAGSKSVLCACL